MGNVTRWGRVSLLGFAVSFGLQVAAGRYVGSFGPPESALDFVFAASRILIDLSAIVLLAFSTYLAIKAWAFPAAGIFLVAGVIGAELVWRFIIHDLPGNGFKLVAVAIYFAQPVIAALGIGAVASVLRQFRIQKAATSEI